jgi:hypothetical protein
MNKHALFASMGWRELSQAFIVLGKYIAWNFGNPIQVRIESDSIAGCGGRFFLAKDHI